MSRSAESYENEIRYWRDQSMRLSQRLQALTNTPETHTDKGLHKDPTGNAASFRVDRQRKRN